MPFWHLKVILLICECTFIKLRRLHMILPLYREPPLLGQADVKLFKIIPNFQNLQDK